MDFRQCKTIDTVDGTIDISPNTSRNRMIVKRKGVCMSLFTTTTKKACTGNESHNVNILSDSVSLKRIITIFSETKTTDKNIMWLLPQKHVLAPKTIFHRRRLSMFDCVGFVFYWANSTENCGVFFSYNWESKLKSCDFFVIFFVVLSVDYDL